MPMVFLKEFPSAQNPNIACYQAIVEASANVVGDVKGRLILEDYTLNIRKCESHPIVKDLGLHCEKEENSYYKIKPILQFSVEFDYQMNAGKEVYKKTT